MAANIVRRISASLPRRNTLHVPAKDLECPVCLALPSGPVLQCQKGHHLCDECFYKLPGRLIANKRCVICRGKFDQRPPRNYALEAAVRNSRRCFQCVIM